MRALEAIELGGGGGTIDRLVQKLGAQRQGLVRPDHQGARMEPRHRHSFFAGEEQGDVAAVSTLFMRGRHFQRPLIDGCGNGGKDKTRLCQQGFAGGTQAETRST